LISQNRNGDYRLKIKLLPDFNAGAINGWEIRLENVVFFTHLPIFLPGPEDNVM
jgi:hypothetical protein